MSGEQEGRALRPSRPASERGCFVCGAWVAPPFGVRVTPEALVHMGACCERFEREHGALMEMLARQFQREGSGCR